MKFSKRIAADALKKRDFDMGNLLLFTFPCILSTILLFSNVCLPEGEKMNPAIQIVLAVLPTIGVIAVAIFHLRSGNKRIDDVYHDTKEMRPKAEVTEKYAEETNRYLTREMKGNIEKLLEGKADISLLSEEVKYRKRLAAEYKGMTTRERLVVGIDELYERNAFLEQECQQKEEMILSLERKNRELKEKIEKITIDHTEKIDQAYTF